MRVVVNIHHIFIEWGRDLSCPLHIAKQICFLNKNIGIKNANAAGHDKTIIGGSIGRGAEARSIDIVVSMQATLRYEANLPQ